MAQASFSDMRRGFLCAPTSGCEAEPVAGILLGKREIEYGKTENYRASCKILKASDFL